MGKFIFDGPNKKIRLNPAYVVGGVLTFSCLELWSRWIDWQIDNQQYLPALDIIYVPNPNGGFIGPYLFLRNDLGWVGVPPEYEGCSVRISGGSFSGMSAVLPILENVVGQETDLVIEQSNIVNTISTSGSTGPTAAEIAMAVWMYAERTLTAASSSSLTTEEHDKLMAIPTAPSNAAAVWEYTR